MIWDAWAISVLMWGYVILHVAACMTFPGPNREDADEGG